MSTREVDETNPAIVASAKSYDELMAALRTLAPAMRPLLAEEQLVIESNLRSPMQEGTV